VYGLHNANPALFAGLLPFNRRLTEKKYLNL